MTTPYARAPRDSRAALVREADERLYVTAR